MVTTNTLFSSIGSYEGVAVRQGSPQCGRPITVKKGVIGLSVKIKTVLALLTERGIIDCMVTGVRRHSADLPQSSSLSFSQLSLFILGFIVIVCLIFGIPAARTEIF